MTVTASEALAEIQRLAAADRIDLPRHVRLRMAERGATYPDVKEALSTAKRCTAQPGERWKVPGLDRDGDELTCIVMIEADAVVITIF